jgi:hypothetical protein
VTIVAIFAAIIAPNLLGRISSANQDKALIEATKIADQVTIYLSENRGSSLGGDFDLEVLVPKYIDSVDSLTDPWGTRYQIAVPGIGREFDVYSLARIRLRAAKATTPTFITAAIRRRAAAAENRRHFCATHTHPSTSSSAAPLPARVLDR